MIYRGAIRVDAAVATFLFLAGCCSVGVSTISDNVEPSESLTVATYDIELRVGWSEIFQVAVTLTTAPVARQSDVVVLHSRRLRLGDVTVVQRKDAGGTATSTVVPVVQVVGHEDRGEVEIRLGSALVPGATYSVSIAAEGRLGNPADFGLVRVPYEDVGVQTSLVVFRGSPTSARTLFPCVDLADAAADVNLVVLSPSNFTAVSNAARINATSVGEDTLMHTFASTTIAPHQLGLVVGNLVLAAPLGSPNVYVRRQAAAAGEDVQKYVSSLCNASKELTGLSPEHLSVVALPGVGDVPPTVGLLALDEADIVLGPLAPPSARRDARLRLADAVLQAAVLARSRPRRWGDAWAGLGFAAHLQHRLAEEAEAGWRMDDQQLALQVQDVLEEGAWASAHALNPGMENSGSVLMRMLEHSLNSTVYAKAVKRYYQRSVGVSVEVDDLYDAFAYETFQGSGGLPMNVAVPTVMASWADKPGYPVLTVIRDYETNTMTVSQKRFLWSSNASSAPNEEEERWVPLSWTCAKCSQFQNADTNAVDWLVPHENDMEVEVPRSDAFEWVYFNLIQGAPYRVNYDVQNWLFLTQELTGPMFDEVLPAGARAQLLADALALARAGQLDYALALDLAAYLHREDDVLPWMVARRAFRHLEARLAVDEAGDNALALLRQFERDLLKTVYLDDEFGLGSVGQDPGTLLLRETLFRWACDVGLDKCLDVADKAYALWRSNTRVPVPEEMETVLCRAVSRDEAKDVVSWSLDKLRDAVGAERRVYVRAVACAPTSDALQWVAERALSTAGPFLSSEVGEFLVAASSRGPRGWDVVSRYLEGDHARIANRTGNVGDLKASFFNLASRVSSQAQLVTLKRVAGSVEDAVGPSAVRAALQEASTHLAWAADFRDSVVSWLVVHVDAQDVTTAGPSPQSTSQKPATESTPTPTATSAHPDEGSGAVRVSVSALAVLFVAAVGSTFSSLLN